MMHFDKDLLLCDLAETYNIYDFKGLPVNTLATLSCGLRENSRIKMAIREDKLDYNMILLAKIFDGIQLLLWQNTKDGSKGRNKPKSILNDFIKEKKTIKGVAITSEEFLKNYKKIFKKGSDQK